MKLEVGDVLIRKNYRQETLVKVSRVTGKRAYTPIGSGEQALDREYEIREPFAPSIKAFGMGKWNTVYYYKATPEDVARINEKNEMLALKHYIEAAARTDQSLENLRIAANALGYGS